MLYPEGGIDVNSAVISILALGAAVYAAMCLYIVFQQPRYVYYPVRKIDSTPKDAGLKYEDVVITARDGVRISAWYVPAKAKDALTVVFCHGNGDNISGRVDTVASLHSLGCNTLIFDYRGYGNSEGQPTEHGTYLDALACWNWLLSQKDCRARDIVIYGRSLGGAVASWLAAEVKPRALVMESTFTSAGDMARVIFPIFPGKLLCRFKYDSLARMPGISCPVFIAHSPEDRKVPFAHGKRLYSAANEPKRFYEFSGGHNVGALESDSSYRQEFLDFCWNTVPRDDT